MRKSAYVIAKISAIIIGIGVTVMSSGCGFFGKVSVPNPWAETDPDGIEAVMKTRFTVPESGENVIYRYNSAIKLAEMDFDMGNVHYCARIAEKNEYEDISGMYYAWNMDEALNDFDGAEARIMKYNGENGDVTVVEAFYTEAGLQYSLSASSRSESAGNLISIARTVWGDIPSSAVPTEVPTTEPEPTDEPVTDPYAKILAFAESFIGKNYDEIVAVLGAPILDENAEDGTRVLKFEEFELVLNPDGIAETAGLITDEPESEATPECI